MEIGKRTCRIARGQPKDDEKRPSRRRERSLRLSEKTKSTAQLKGRQNKEVKRKKQSNSRGAGRFVLQGGENGV